MLGGNGYVVTRLTASGQFDQSFGDNGTTTFALDPPITLLSRDSTVFFVGDLAIDDQDRVLVFSGADRVIVGRAGSGAAIESAGTVVLRLDDSGAVDQSLNGTGYELIPVLSELRRAAGHLDGEASEDEKIIGRARWPECQRTNYLRWRHCLRWLPFSIDQPTWL